MRSLDEFNCNEDLTGLTRISPLSWPKDLIAFWDFTEEQEPYKAKAGVDTFQLGVGGTAPTKVTMKPFGGGLKFNGSSDYLRIPADQVGALSVAQFGDEVTVVAWVKRPVDAPDNNSFIAGLWQEDNTNPKRQYGLFTHLPTYGGFNRVCGHVSHTGGASPNLPYSRDYSTSARMIGRGILRCIGFTYDGTQVRSYLDGIADICENYTEPLLPLGEGLTYHKNPYYFDLGLNRQSISDFTVGAVKLTAGMGNFFNSELGGLAIFKRALTDEEMMKLHTDTIAAGAPIQHYDFMKEGMNNSCMGDYGWRVTGGETPIDMTYQGDSGAGEMLASWTMAGASLTSKSYAFVSSLEGATGLNLFETNRFGNIMLGQLERVEVMLNGNHAGNSIKFCINVNEKWYATRVDYYDTSGGSEEDWSSAKTQVIPITQNPEDWSELNYVPGRVLSLGSNPIERIPNDEIKSFGILANELRIGSVIRLSDIMLFSNQSHKFSITCS
jgi:hypothetical protein